MFGSGGEKKCKSGAAGPQLEERGKLDYFVKINYQLGFLEGGDAPQSNPVLRGQQRKE